jgi:hypothetical protein
MQQFNFLILDAAIAEGNINSAIALNKNYKSLIKSKSEDELESVAPYLFSMNKSTIDFSNWFFGVGWNKNWGVLVFSNASFEDVYNHFCKYLIVTNDDKQEVYFRFYDPRVLRIILLSFDTKQLTSFFGPLSAFVVEDEDEGFVLKFSLFNNQLQTIKITKEEFFENIKIDNRITNDNIDMQKKTEDSSSMQVNASAGWNFTRKN